MMRLVAKKRAVVTAGICICLAWILAPRARADGESAKISGSAGNYSSYFLKTQRLRHHRYELRLKQNAAYTTRFNSVIEGRLRFDPAISKQSTGQYHQFDKAVRDDEMAEAEMRQLYLDYLGDSYRLMVGLQQIDWIDTLSPLINDGMTPMDLRYGGYGSASDVIIPVEALRFNHQFALGTLDWLVVPKPKHSRLPKGSNGYGLYESAAANSTETSSQDVEEEEIPSSLNQVEGGLRYLTSGEGWELTLLGYRGHQKTPVFRSDVVASLGQAPFYETSSRYPLSPTFGVFTAFSGDAWVMRLMAFHEPSRAPSHVIVAPQTLAEPKRDESKGPREVRSKIGFGFDYVFSKHFKFYSEQYGTRTKIVNEQPGITVVGYEGKPVDDYTVALHMTNETFEAVTLAFDVVATSPYKANVLIPSLAWFFAENYEVDLGARLVRSYDVRSRYESLKDTSQVYAAFYKHFSVGN
jgi:hypothetical protein